MAKTPTDIRSLARSHTDSAIKVLSGIMQQKDAPPAARVSAAQALLDRGWGKPDATLFVQHKRAAEMSDDELQHIAAGSGEDATSAPVDPTQLN